MKLHEDVSHKTTIKRFKTLEEDFRKVHGNTYNYDLVEYISITNKVKIICKTHGIFEQTPDAHLKCGCIKCAYIKTHNIQRKTLQTFITEANKTHKNKYDYSLADYKSNITKVKIICPIHGEFMQIPTIHLKGGGCPICAKHQRHQTRQKRYYEKLHSQLINVDIPEGYSCILNKDDLKIDVYCNKHGKSNITFNQLINNKRCVKCKKEELLKSKHTEWVEFCSNKYNGLFDYSLTNYQHSEEKVLIKCKKHNYLFETTPYSHKKGTNGSCPLCWEEGRRKKYFNKPTILYYIKIEKVGFLPVYKIGITTKTVKQRFMRDINNSDILFSVLHVEKFADGKSAFLKEQLILNSFKEYQYKGENILEEGGNSELFTIDCYDFKKVIK